MTTEWTVEFVQLTKGIGVTWLVTIGGRGRPKSIVGIRNLNLQRSRLGKRGTIRSLVQITLGKGHRELTVHVFLCQRVTQMPLLCLPYNAGFSFFFCLSATQINVLKTSLYFIYSSWTQWPKKLFLRRKNIGVSFTPLHCPKLRLRLKEYI